MGAPLGGATSAQREYPHDRRSVAPRTPQGVGEPGRAVAPAMREQVRRLGCVPPHNPRIFTFRLQPGAQRMSPLQSGTAGLRGLRAICLSGPICCGQRRQRRLPGRCGASARYVLPTAATTATAGLGVRVDPDWVACPPTRPAGHTPAHNHADIRKGSVSTIAAPPPSNNG